MQRAARRQLTRHVMSHFHQHRILLVNATFSQSIKADDRRHHLHWILHKLLSACHPSPLTVFRSCLHLSLLIRCFSSGSPSPLPSLIPQDSDGFPSTNESTTDRNNAEDTEDNCSQAFNASEPAFDNTKVSVGLAWNEEEGSDDAMLMEVGKVDSPSALLSDASGQQDTKQVASHRICADPHCLPSFQDSQCNECVTFTCEVGPHLHGDEGIHVKDGASKYAVVCGYSCSFDTLSHAGNFESCEVKDDLATDVLSSIASNARGFSYQPCSTEEELGTSCEASILLILEKQGWGQHTEDVLHSFIGQLTSEIVAKIVDSLRDAKMAFSFLQWVGRQENYQHREEIFTKVVGRLGKNREFELSWTVLQYMKKHGLKVDYAFSIFIQRLKNADMADDIVKAMDNMMSLDVIPTVSLYTVALQVTLRGNDFKIAERLYIQMRQAGLQLDAKLYSTLITGFGKAGMLHHALFFFKEMHRDGVPPNSIAYTSLIRAFAGAGKYEDGQKIFSQMVQNNCLPVALSRGELECALFGVNTMEQINGFLENLESSGHPISVHTYNRAIQYLLDRKMLLEGVQLFRRLLDLGEMEPQECDSQPNLDKKATRPNKVSYSLLICGLCKGGQLTEAILLFREMLVKGISTSSDLCNCLLYGLSSSEGFMYEAVELARHIARKKLIVDAKTQKVFLKALKASGDMSKALKIFDIMKWRGCIDSSLNFFASTNVEG